MKQVTVKFIQFIVVVFSAVISVIAVPIPIPVPVPTVSDVYEPSPSPLFRNVINKNYEIVEGPKEFLLPLAPLKSILTKHIQTKKSEGSTAPSFSERISDLDYMVYGKVYLMKALGIASRSSIGGSSAGNVVSSSTTEVEDGISFPAQKGSDVGKRAYRYKYWYTPRPSDYNKESSEGSSSVQLENRKLEVRSAERRVEETEEVTEAVDTTEGGEQSSPELDLTELTGESQSSSSTTTTASPTSLSPIAKKLNKHENDFMADEEAVELLRRLMPQALAFYENERKNGNSKTSENGDDVDDDDNDSGEAIPGSSELNNNNSSSSNSNNSSNGGIDVDNRFLIHVPPKPTCPEGQRKNHRGICKPVFQFNPSSTNDEIMTRRRLTSSPHIHLGVMASASSNIKETSSKLEHSEKRNLHLSSLFTSFLKLEKSLEKAVKEAEQKLGQVRDDTTAAAAAAAAVETNKAKDGTDDGAAATAVKMDSSLKQEKQQV